MELSDEDLAIVERLQRAREITQRGLGATSHAAVLAVFEHVVMRDQLAAEVAADEQARAASAWQSARLVSVALH